MRVGILAVQGDYEAHAAVFQRLSVEHVLVREPSDMKGVDALVLPGGESTTQLQFLAEEGLEKIVREFAEKGGAVFGTCAGAILLAREVKNPPQKSLGLTDLVLTRNAYGRQVASEVREGKTKLKSEPLEMVFIRAPIIDRTGEGVEVLAESDGKPVLVRQGKMLVATFHPELTSDDTVHQYFLKMAAEENAQKAGRNGR